MISQPTNNLTKNFVVCYKENTSDVILHNDEPEFQWNQM